MFNFIDTIKQLIKYFVYSEQKCDISYIDLKYDNSISFKINFQLFFMLIKITYLIAQFYAKSSK